MESYLSGQKILSQFDGQLYCAIDERSNAVELTEKGLELLSKGQADAFIVPSLEEGYLEIDGNDALAPEEKIEARRALETRYRRLRSGFIPSTSSSRPTGSSRRM